MNAPRDIPGDPGLELAHHESERGPYVGAPPVERLTRLAHPARLNRLLLELHRGFGWQRWWPAKTPFEVMVGAVLTQNTSWSNVERALSNLDGRGRLTPGRLLAAPRDELLAAVRPSGYYNEKTRNLLALSEWYLRIGGLAALRARPLAPLREELLGVRGVGPETADSILCYAAGRRTFVVDTYARRVASRHGFIEARAPYETVREWFQRRLVAAQRVYEETHALFVRAGYDHCKPTPTCEGCPATTPQALRRSGG